MRKAITSLILLCYASLLPANELVIGVSHIPPHFIGSSEQGLGIELIREAFSRIPEYRIKLEFMSIRRGYKEFTSGRLKAAANIFQPVNGCKSDPVFHWREVAISMKQKKLELNSVKDLGRLTVVSFKNATQFIGEEFSQMAAANQHYHELDHEEALLKMLIKGRADVYVGDYLVFLHFLNELFEGKHLPSEFDTFPLMNNYTHMMFQDDAMCQQFNQALASMRDDGSYQAIYDKYQQRLLTQLTTATGQ